MLHLTTKWLPNKPTHIQKLKKIRKPHSGFIMESPFNTHARALPMVIKGEPRSGYNQNRYLLISKIILHSQALSSKKKLHPLSISHG
jgi:hypothetical protein